jgi:hypothetical protein
MARSNWPLLLAAAVVMTAPPMALFLVGQRYLLGEVWGRGKAEKGNEESKDEGRRTEDEGMVGGDRPV